jgi:hypothetical protein
LLILNPIYPDSIDLQDRDAPTAQVRTKPTATGHLAPHQAETLREVAAETAEENLRSPRISWVNSEAEDIQKYADDLAAGIAESLNGGQQSAGTSKMQTGPQQDALAIAQNGGLSGQEVDDGDMDGETEVDMDDDMMDKISSSPSIEDGGLTFTLPHVGPSRAGFLFPWAPSRGPSANAMVSDARSSSPYLDYPDPAPLQGARNDAPVTPMPRRHHHHQLYGKSPSREPTNESLAKNADASVGSHDCDRGQEPSIDDDQARVPENTTVELELSDTKSLRSVNQCGPGVEECYFDDRSSGDERDSGEIDSNWDDEDDNDYRMTFPYDLYGDEANNDDDDDDPFGLEDSRHVDSGWGGECLQDTEDIDFEFVYALHTFVATVEGQANATKGDTMVLLDDSNSYWWLVRVVKDSSIGMFFKGPASKSGLWLSELFRLPAGRAY